jgi:peptide/nickel transport system permease protein
LPAFIARRLLLAVGVLLAVSYGSFVLIATQFSTTCPGKYSPGGLAPPLAETAKQATALYWQWLQGVPSGRSISQVCDNSGLVAPPLLSSVGHTFALLAVTLLIVVLFSLVFGVFAATRAGTLLDLGFRGFSYAAWAVPPFLLALVLQSVLSWAGSTYGFRPFPLSGWPGACTFSFGCAPAPQGTGYWLAVSHHVVVPAVALAVAFVGVHSRFLRSSLLVALSAPYTTTARAKGLSERRVVLRHALRNSLGSFTSALLLDFGTVLGAALAIDWVFRMQGLGMLFLTQVAGVGSGDGPRYLDAYAIQALLTLTAVLVVVSSLLAELAVAWLDPRVRVQ